MDENTSNQNIEFTVDKNTADKLIISAKEFRLQCHNAIIDAEEKLIYADKFIKPTPYDPTELLSFFSCLKLIKGFKLDSYYGRNPGGGQGSGTGRGYAYVISENCKLPVFNAEDNKIINFYLIEFEWEDVTKHPVPNWAVWDVESYLEGDGSPLSYFQASIFMRELRELGAGWHHLYWSVHEVITSKEKIPKKKLKWIESKPEEPKDWLPDVWIDENKQWNVAFYTHCDMDAKILLYQDVFTENYKFKSYKTDIASYTGGYVF